MMGGAPNQMNPMFGHRQGPAPQPPRPFQESLIDDCLDGDEKLCSFLKDYCKDSNSTIGKVPFKHFCKKTCTGCSPKPRPLGMGLGMGMGAPMGAPMGGGFNPMMMGAPMGNGAPAAPMMNQRPLMGMGLGAPGQMAMPPPMQPPNMNPFQQANMNPFAMSSGGGVGVGAGAMQAFTPEKVDTSKCEDRGPECKNVALCETNSFIYQTKFSDYCRKSCKKCTPPAGQSS